ncbi:MAG: hypothetical protein SPH11_07555 [Lentihominibacter sp.]|uniref:hypothetical protein n=1 Tax=Lentihominibacter sp. TaxID=2944216 RepID=UPI002A91F67D|nr:hypothetical protein [Lentihominibacter sp.]MDY5287590.1 hypothetical protein [Lentihominibacter sp.]
MGKYALNLGNNGRILSVCVCIEGQTYENRVDSFPNGDVTEYRYVDGEFIHDPEPKPDPPEPEPTAEELLNIILGTGGETNEQ